MCTGWMFLPAQTKYLYRRNAASKILFFELLRERGLIEEVIPWYSPVMPKPAYQNTTSEAVWDIPIYAVHNEVRANRINARVVRHERKEVCTIETSCPWIESRAKKGEEKTLKYGPMMWELKQRYNHGYRVETIPIESIGAHLPTPRYGQYLTHAHNHITRAVAAMDSCFALVGAHQHGIAVGSMSKITPRPLVHGGAGP